MSSIELTALPSERDGEYWEWMLCRDDPFHNGVGYYLMCYDGFAEWFDIGMTKHQAQKTNQKIRVKLSTEPSKDAYKCRRDRASYFSVQDPRNGSWHQYDTYKYMQKAVKKAAKRVGDTFYISVTVLGDDE